MKSAFYLGVLEADAKFWTGPNEWAWLSWAFNDAEARLWWDCVVREAQADELERS